jgi:hypothetical protein
VAGRSHAAARWKLRILREAEQRSTPCAIWDRSKSFDAACARSLTQDGRLSTGVEARRQQGVATEP